MDTPGEAAVGKGFALMTEDEDLRLWSAVQQGDDHAFETLVTRHCGKVASVAGQLLSNAHDVEDVVQETFVRAYAARHRYPHRQCVRAWLLRIAINLCKSRRRTSWWRRVCLTNDGELLQPGTHDPGELAQATIFQQEVVEAVRRLPEHLRLPFTLRYYEELSGAEIAIVLGWNESTVWTRIYTARRELKKCLTGPADLPGSTTL